MRIDLAVLLGSVAPIDVVNSVTVCVVERNTTAVEAAGAARSTRGSATDRNCASTVRESAAISAGGVTTDRNRGAAVAPGRSGVDRTRLSAVAASCITVDRIGITTVAAVSAGGGAAIGRSCDAAVATVAADCIAIDSGCVAAVAAIPGGGDHSGRIAAVAAISAGCHTTLGREGATAVAAIACERTATEGHASLAAVPAGGIAATDDTETTICRATVAADAREDQIRIGRWSAAGIDSGIAAVTEIEHQVRDIAVLREHLPVERATAVATVSTGCIAPKVAVATSCRAADTAVAADCEVCRRLGEIHGAVVIDGEDANGDGASALSTLAAICVATVTDMTVDGIAFDDLAHGCYAGIANTWGAGAILGTSRGAGAVYGIGSHSRF